MCAASTPSRCSATKIWSFVYAKERNVYHARSAPKEADDVWTWTAIDSDTT